MAENKDILSEEDLSSFKGLAQALTGVFDNAYAVYAPMVDSVLRDWVTEERDIERIMDGLLDFGEDPRFVQLYKKLCRHVYSRFPDLVKEHVALFLENHPEQCKQEETN